MTQKSEEIIFCLHKNNEFHIWINYYPEIKKKMDNHAELMRFFLIALSIMDRCNQIQVISVLIFYYLNQNFLQIPLTVLINLLQDKGKVRISVSIKTFKIKKKSSWKVKIMYKTYSWSYTCTTYTYSFNSAFYHTKPYLPRFIQLDIGKHVNPEIIWSQKITGFTLPPKKPH